MLADGSREDRPAVPAAVGKSPLPRYAVAAADTAVDHAAHGNGRCMRKWGKCDVFVPAFALLRSSSIVRLDRGEFAMNKRGFGVRGGGVLALFFLAWAAMPSAFAQDDITRQLINDPNTAWTVYGPQTSRKIKDRKVQGGRALEVSVAAPGGNPWDTAAQVPITGSISRGDRILAAAWLKAANADGAPAKLAMRIQIDSPPYDAVAENLQSVGDGWQLHSVETVATRDYAKGTCTLVVHLGSARQVVDLGPTFVLNRGPAP
jgi:hypothetical protein